MDEIGFPWSISSSRIKGKLKCFFESRRTPREGNVTSAFVSVVQQVAIGARRGSVSGETEIQEMYGRDGQTWKPGPNQ